MYIAIYFHQIVYMSIKGDTPYGSVSIFLQSSKATKSNSDANKIFYLENPISPPPNTRILMVLSEFEMPNTVYNINSDVNNKISFTTVSGTATITLTAGNYDDEDLIDSINAALSDSGVEETLGARLQLSLSNTTYKYSFTTAVPTLEYNGFSIVNTTDNPTTLLKEIGLTNQLPTANATSFSATQIGDLGGIANILIAAASFIFGRITKFYSDYSILKDLYKVKIDKSIIIYNIR